MPDEVKWWRIRAYLLCDDVPTDCTYEFYALCAQRKTAVSEAKDAILAEAHERDEYGAYSCKVTSVKQMAAPPAGALYMMMPTSRLM